MSCLSSNLFGKRDTRAGQTVRLRYREHTLLKSLRIRVFAN